MSPLYRPDLDAGINTGLRVWVAFIIGFWFVGLRAELCIFLGAIGGLAAGWIVAYWLAEEDRAAPTEQPPPADRVSPLGQVFRQPVERFRNLGKRRIPRLSSRKPPKQVGK